MKKRAIGGMKKLSLSIFFLALFFRPALAGPQHPAAQVSAFSCLTTIFFSPRGGAAGALIKEIGGAQERIRIALYGLNNPEVVDALIAAKGRGVDVAIKLDNLQSAGKGQAAQISRLRRANIQARVSELSRLLHDKFMAVDGRRVWTGSYNWTVQAELRHRENIVLLDCPQAASIYEQEWNHIEIEKPR